MSEYLKPEPRVCPVCREEVDGYYGLLCFPDDSGEIPVTYCPNHKNPQTGEEDRIELVPAR